MNDFVSRDYLNKLIKNVLLILFLLYNPGLIQYCIKTVILYYFFAVTQ